MPPPSSPPSAASPGAFMDGSILAIVIATGRTLGSALSRKSDGYCWMGLDGTGLGQGIGLALTDSFPYLCSLWPSCCSFCSCTSATRSAANSCAPAASSRTPVSMTAPLPTSATTRIWGGSHTGAQLADRTAETPRGEGNEPFCVGPPHGYQLRPWQPPRLPSYESIRKKDRQQHIHQLIARRFGLWARGEMPPTYEESLRAEVGGQGAVAFPGPRNTAV
ncbi:uncharacterized protein LOC119937606 [Tachyglossus aculeatus]|uniref:uncharacterized protein LOC119937606 n=1 Tax=Tachyglossus aculeatus TaxID=9261 RepID=UPI0018F6FCC3|nr:uncharacterized protein LOC119937606 [Tachyglossus aculeatus]